MHRASPAAGVASPGRPRRVPLLVALIAASSLSFPAAAGADSRFFVSPSGADSNPGTKAAPFETLGRAQLAERDSLRRRPRANVDVILRGGVYRLSKPLTFNAKDSPGGGAKVVFRAFSGEHPVISGAVKVPGSAWSRFDKDADIWRARVGKLRTGELYVNGQRADLASTEDYPAGFRPSWNGGGPSSGIEYLPTIQPNGLNPPSWGDPSTWTNVRQIQAVILTQWKAMTVPVQSITPAQGPTPGLLRMVNPAWTNANMFLGTDGQPGIWSFWQVTRFQDAYQFLDNAGEWYLDQKRGWLYYKPYPWQNMKAADVEVPVLQSLIQGKGTAKRPVSRLRFRGLTFSFATWLQPSGSNGYVSDQSGFHLVGTGYLPNTIGHYPNDAATPGNVSFRFAHDVRFVNDRFQHLGAVGVALGTGSHHTVVRSSTFTDIGSSAVTLSGIAPVDHHPTSKAQLSFGNTIAKNLVSHVAWEYPDAAGIFGGFASNTRIVRNTIEDVPWSGIALGWGWGLLDPGGFPGLPHATQYQWGRWDTPTANRNSVVAGNTIREFLGLLWDGGAIYTTGFQGTSLQDGLRIQNNTAYGKRPKAGGNTFYTDGGSRYITISGNTSHDNPIGVLDFGPPPQVGDPLPYSALPSAPNGLPYGSEIGGCTTYGDIAYQRNSWFQAPMQTEIQLNNDLYYLLTGGQSMPYSSDGFFDVCPYTAGGVSYPTNLSYSGNVIYPAKP